MRDTPIAAPLSIQSTETVYRGQMCKTYRFDDEEKITVTLPPDLPPDAVMLYLYHAYQAHGVPYPVALPEGGGVEAEPSRIITP